MGTSLIELKQPKQPNALTLFAWCAIFLLSYFAITVDAKATQPNIEDNGHREQQGLFTLSNSRWQYRLLIFNVPSQAQLPVIDQSVKDEYKFAIIALINGNAYYQVNETRLQRLSDNDQDLLIHQYWQQDHVWLVGLDGKLKARYKMQTFQLDQIIALINSMPLRQLERKNDQ